jgi:predicted secreted protein
MSVGIGIVGREVTFTLGGSAIVGVLSKGISFSNEMGDTTDDNSAGWQEFLATPLLKSAEFSVSGQTKNLELVAAYFGASNIFPVVITYPDGSTITADFAMTGAPSLTHESNTLSTFECSFTSSGAIAWVAGT